MTALDFARQTEKAPVIALLEAAVAARSARRR